MEWATVKSLRFHYVRSRRRCPTSGARSADSHHRCRPWDRTMPRRCVPTPTGLHVVSSPIRSPSFTYRMRAAGATRPLALEWNGRGVQGRVAHLEPSAPRSRYSWRLWAHASPGCSRWDGATSSTGSGLHWQVGSSKEPRGRTSTSRINQPRRSSGGSAQARQVDRARQTPGPPCEVNLDRSSPIPHR